MVFLVYLLKFLEKNYFYMKLNIGLSGDKYVEKIYPAHKTGPFDIEIMNINGQINHKSLIVIIKFCRYFPNGNIEFEKRKYIKKIRYENFKNILKKKLIKQIEEKDNRSLMAEREFETFVFLLKLFIILIF